MKTATRKQNCRPVLYPNAATRYELFHKLLDAAVIIACGMGISVMILLSAVFQ